MMTRPSTNFFGEWLRRRRDRVLLEQMDDRMLADIGIARSQIDDCVANGRRGR